jgi:hypothetical protein
MEFCKDKMENWLESGTSKETGVGEKSSAVIKKGMESVEIHLWQENKVSIN